jgi:hypothetical protein
MNSQKIKNVADAPVSRILPIPLQTNKLFVPNAVEPSSTSIASTLARFWSRFGHVFSPTPSPSESKVLQEHPNAESVGVT